MLAEVSQDLEVERSRNAVLAAALSSAKAEREYAQAEAAAARQRVHQLEQQLQYANSAGISRSFEYFDVFQDSKLKLFRNP